MKKLGENVKALGWPESQPDDAQKERWQMAGNKEGDNRCKLNDADFRKKVFEKGKKTCFWCRHPLDIGKMTIDHLIPKSHGGSDDFQNLWPSCRFCNELKSNMVLSSKNKRNIFRKKAKDAKNACVSNVLAKPEKRGGELKISVTDEKGNAVKLIFKKELDAFAAQLHETEKAIKAKPAKLRLELLREMFASAWVAAMLEKGKGRYPP